MLNTTVELHFLEHRDRPRVLSNASNGSYLALTRGKMTSYAYKILRNWEAAEDAVQEAYLRALSYSDSYNSRRPFAGWFFITLTRVCLQARSDEGHVPEMVDYEVVDNKEEYSERGVGPEEASVTTNLLEDVLKVRRFMSDRDQSVVTLYFVYQHTRPQVAQILGLGKRNVDRIIDNFRALLKDHEGV